ncbi:MAG: hypothetical protein LC795_21140 [Acidobacteria bacterium]|nr:hypothetical protein [Acidobacteriota bacterium]
MESETDRDEQFTRYLLGDLPEEECARLEELYFDDDEAFESLLAARDELADLHARGELKGRRRERFEEHFLSTGPRRQRAREAKELVEFSTKAAAAEGENLAAGTRAAGSPWWASLPAALGRRSPALRYALAALLLCAALGGAWLLFKRGGDARPERAGGTPPATPDAVARRPADEETRPRPDGGQDEGAADAPAPPSASPTPGHTRAPETASNRRATPTSSSAPPTAGVASILLSPVLTRGGAGPSNTLLLRPETTTARLRLSFKGGGDYRRYVAVLRTIEGEQVWRGAATAAGAAGPGKTAVADIPARVFRKQDHTATLYGVTAAGETQEVGEYFFRVSRDQNQ